MGLDRMLVLVRKIDEADPYVEYEFQASYWVADPNRPGRSMVEEECVGRLILDKSNGTTTLTHPMPHDDDMMSFARATYVLRRHWEAGECPDRTMWATG